ncbi:membrane associated DNAJ with 7 transmembrane domain [Cryptosporidium sp. chipmunk genotype I]|uniref:membrane associated DNAJ with 7 transmembrane domain n=1 Tax=Cryptosporidium sp. chipmunk genotype I TaxID=1280935 RepID=UPI00351A522E|nr:membrane associated DNAJ with 7 transmembrane domain [Cryptosporidium sp. chipmunk genotype I]
MIDDQLIIYTLVISPIVGWLTSTKRAWNKKNQINGVIFALIVLVIACVLQNVRVSQNYYQILGISSNASRSEITAAYRKLALKFHPDKNSDPSAREIYSKIRNANEILSNDLSRSWYRRFGTVENNLNSYKVTEDEAFIDYPLHLTIVPFITAVIPICLSLLMWSDQENIRGIILCFIVWTLSCGILLRFDRNENDFLTFIPIFGSFLPFEKIRVLEGLYITIMNSLQLVLPFFTTRFYKNELAEFYQSLLRKKLRLLIYIEDFYNDLKPESQKVNGESEVSTYNFSIIAPDFQSDVLKAEIIKHMEQTSMEFNQLLIEEPFLNESWDSSFYNVYNLLEDNLDLEEKPGLSIGTVIFILFWAYKIYSAFS